MQVRERSQLSHVGDGQRCGTLKAMKDAVAGVQGGRGAAAMLFGVAGCGKTAMMARFVLERRAAIAKQVGVDFCTADSLRLKMVSIENV